MPKFSLSKVIEALRLHHGLLVPAADHLGCARQTLYNYAEKYPAVAEVLAEERERFIDLAAQGLYHHLEEQAPWAIALVLRTFGKSRGFVDRQELTDPNQPSTIQLYWPDDDRQRPQGGPDRLPADEG
jgi:hypothetical protein